MTARNAASEMTKRQFADTYGVSEAQLERLFHQGMPHEKKTSRKIVIPMPDGRVWYHKYLVDKGKRQAAPTSIDEARRRKEAAQAELAELELAEARRELMKVEDGERVIAEAFARVRARLLNLPPRIAGIVVGAESIQDAQARVDPLVREVMEELHKADDLPESPFKEEDADAA